MHRRIMMVSGIIGILLLVLGFLLIAGPASAQSQGFGQGTGVCRFVDEDGDGFNDLAPDDDGDGIPNGLDPDYVRPMDGEGRLHKHMWLGGIVSRMFGRAMMYQESGHAFGMEMGPGINTMFGPGEGGAHGHSSGEDQAHNAGHRGGRR